MSALVLAAALVIAPAPVATPPSECKAAAPIVTADAGTQGLRRLDQLPDARLMRTVIRSVGGCDYLEVKVAGDGWALTPSGAPARKVPVPADRR